MERRRLRTFRLFHEPDACSRELMSDPEIAPAGRTGAFHERHHLHHRPGRGGHRGSEFLRLPLKLTTDRSPPAADDRLSHAASSVIARSARDEAIQGRKHRAAALDCRVAALLTRKSWPPPSTRHCEPRLRRSNPGVQHARWCCTLDCFVASLLAMTVTLSSMGVGRRPVVNSQ